MVTMRAILASLVCGGLAAFLSREILLGVRAGRIRHTDSSTYCVRKKNPISFWALVLLFGGFVVALILSWINIIHKIYFGTGMGSA